MTTPPTTPELWRLGELLLIAALVGVAAMIGGKVMALAMGARPLQ